MKKILLIVFMAIFVIIGIVYLVNLRYQIYPVANEDQETSTYVSLVACLEERGVIIYGSRFCPACIDFIDQFGGIEIISPIYVECTNYPERCEREMHTEFVPEIQINGALYDGTVSLIALAELTGCSL